MKVFVVIFAVLAVASIVAAYWNPIHVVTAFCCLLMVINGFAHIKESV
jgi:hypothetical protein